MLTACTPADDTEGKTSGETSKNQAHYFLESLKFVEQAGRQLQTEGLTQTLVEDALLNMDAGMAMAFKVNAAFLNKLDVRLGKNYQRYFVEGVQAYRLGIEAADQDQQKNGVALLGRWAQFWAGIETDIMKKIQTQ